MQKNITHKFVAKQVLAYIKLINFRYFINLYHFHDIMKNLSLFNFRSININLIQSQKQNIRTNFLIKKYSTNNKFLMLLI